MKKIGIVITDGVGYRNFVLSDFLRESESFFGEVVILSCLPKSVFVDISPKIKIIELSVFNEKFITWFFRKTKEIAHLQLHKKSNFGIQDNLRISYSIYKTIRGYSTHVAYFWASFLNTENWIERFNKLQQFSFKNNPVTIEYIDLLEKEKFDILFFTHQRPSFIAPLIFAAQKTKVKTSAFIFSWDNLASKNRMAGNFDYYLVWSQLMKNELIQFYPKTPSVDIEIVGTPQFEPYVLERYKSTKENFISKFGLDQSKKTICFSCGDISTSRNDEFYIETIAKAILDESIPNVNFIVRTSPAEDPVRFEALSKKFSFIKWNFPKWNLSREGHQEVWSQRVPLSEDIKDLRALIEFSDININMLSTMSLDFMQFNKPVINTVFGNETNGLYDDQRFLKFAHIINVVLSKATIIAKNESELLEAIRMYLNNPDLHTEQRRDFNNLQIGKPLQYTSKRIVEKLLAWAQ